MNIPTQPASPLVEILIVEDSPTQAQQLQLTLERQGYHVIHASNGQEAFERAQQHKPTLIISDVVMPIMDGYELCLRVKSDARLADVPVILVTTLSDPQDVIRGLECRADNFIPKPYDERYLLSRVQFVLINREVRQTDQTGMGVEVFFNGKRHFITAERLQILNLLLSTYEAAIQRNSELNRTQDKLRQLNTSLEFANKELETFSYSVSHDLGAPLRHIHGFVDLLGASMAGRLDAEEQRHLATISEAAKHMGRLIEDLLNFSRMGQAEIRRVAVDLNGMLQDAIRGLEPETKGRNIVWKIDLLPPTQADPAMIQQVLVNLLGNAVKYTRGREFTEITVGVRDVPPDIILFVRDNGVGFDMRHVEKLFGVFQRLHSEKEFEGTGIGLANVRRIVARHGGRTWAEGKKDEGATFYFSLPKFQQTG